MWWLSSGFRATNVLGAVAPGLVASLWSTVWAVRLLVAIVVVSTAEELGLRVPRLLVPVVTGAAAWALPAWVAPAVVAWLPWAASGGVLLASWMVRGAGGLAVPATVDAGLVAAATVTVGVLAGWGTGDEVTGWWTAPVVMVAFVTAVARYAHRSGQLGDDEAAAEEGHGVRVVWAALMARYAWGAGGLVDAVAVGASAVWVAGRVVAPAVCLYLVLSVWGAGLEPIAPWVWVLSSVLSMLPRTSGELSGCDEE